MHLDGAEVGEDVQLAAKAEQPGLAALLAAQVVPRGSADGTEQHGVRRLARVEGLVGQRRAELVDRAPTDDVDVDADPRVNRVAHGCEHAQRGVDDLGADAVTGKHDDVRLHEPRPGARQVRHPRGPSRLELGDRRLVLERQARCRRGPRAAGGARTGRW